MRDGCGMTERSSDLGRRGHRESWGALQSLRVLDLTQALAGPYCTQMLADHGAEVVKVEPPVSGDLGRTTGPYHEADTDHVNSGYFHSINRNKKSIVIDLKRPEGRDLILDLVPQYDVVVENFRSGVMDRLGLGYEVLRERNPKLIYAAVRGFGDPRGGESPYADWPAFDVVAQAMGGIAGITGRSAGEPMKVGPGVGDIVPALYLTIGILSAVIRARETGLGQFVDVSMVDAVLALSERIVHQWSFGKKIAGPEGNFHPLMSPFGFYPAQDGHVALAAVSQDFFKILCSALGAPELPEIEAYGSQQARSTAGRQLDLIIADLTSRFTRAELTERLGGRMPFGPVYTMTEIAGDPHFSARDMIVPVTIPGIPETLHIVGVPIKMSETPGRVARRGPRQGEHSDEVLRAAGFAREQIESWRTSGVIR